MTEERSARQAGEGDAFSFAWRESLLFHDFAAADWQELAGMMFRRRVPAGEILWREGEKSSALYCICRGRLEAVKETPEWGKPIIMAGFGPGATVGSLSATAEEAHSTTLTVVEEAELLYLDESGLCRLEESATELRVRLWRGWARLELRRLRQANRRLVTLF